MDEHGPGLQASVRQNGLQALVEWIDRFITRAGDRTPLLHKLQSMRMLTAAGLILSLVGLMLLLLLPPLTRWAMRRIGHLQTNFRGDRIVQSYGLVILCWAGPILILTGCLYSDQRTRALLWLTACVGYGLLGFLDDICGDRKIKGLRGHLNAAIHHHVITTGLIKAVGGGILALWLAFHVASLRPANLLVASAIIALSANAINLMDVRPGRACAVFLVCAIPLLWLIYRTGEPGTSPLLLVMIPTLRIYRADARAVAMLGDTGSNLLGGALGLSVVVYTGIAWQALVLAGLIALHLMAERRSLTELIRNNPVLNAIDRLTGVR